MAEFSGCNRDFSGFLTVISVMYFTSRAVYLHRYRAKKLHKTIFTRWQRALLCSAQFCFYLNHIYNLTSDSDPLIIATHSLKKLIWMGFLNPRYITNHLGSSWKNTRLHSRPVQSKSLGTWVLLFKDSKANKRPLQLTLLRSVGRELVPLLFKAGVFRAAASTLGHLLDMYNIKRQPRPIESDSAVSQDPRVIDVPVKAWEARSKPRKQFDSAPQPWVMLSSLGKEN